MFYVLILTIRSRFLDRGRCPPSPRKTRSGIAGRPRVVAGTTGRTVRPSLDPHQRDRTRANQRHPQHPDQPGERPGRDPRRAVCRCRSSQSAAAETLVKRIASGRAAASRMICRLSHDCCVTGCSIGTCGRFGHATVGLTVA